MPRPSGTGNDAEPTPMASETHDRFLALEQGIEAIGQAYNQVAEGCADLEQRLERLERAASWTTAHELGAMRQKFDSIEFDIQTLIGGRLNEHDKTIGDLQQRTRDGDVDQVLQSVLVRLQRLEKGSAAAGREKKTWVTRLPATTLAKALLDRLNGGGSIEDEALLSSLRHAVMGPGENTPAPRPARNLNTPPSDPEPNDIARNGRPAPPSTWIEEPSKMKTPRSSEHRQVTAKSDQTPAAGEARARKRKRPSRSQTIDPHAAARARKKHMSRTVASETDGEENAADGDALDEDDDGHLRRSRRAPKPVQMAAGTVSWAEARNLTKQRLGPA